MSFLWCNFNIGTEEKINAGSGARLFNAGSGLGDGESCLNIFV